MAFLQIMDITTDDIGSVREIEEDWKAATKGKRTARRRIITRDRDDPNRYRIIVFFDSFDSATTNSQLPETQEFARRFQAAVKEVTFQDLDVIEDEDL